jgi:hypothetical protein
MSNQVTLIIEKTKLPKWKPGTLVKWSVTADDFLWEEGKVEIKVQIVIGNKQYISGKRLTLYLFPNLVTS